LWWGKLPSLTYHDHPPMVGWINYFLITIFHNLAFIRISSVVFTLLISLGIVDVLRRIDDQNQNTAWLIGAIFLVVPMNLLFDIVTTDVPVAFFMFGAGYFYLRFELSKNESLANFYIILSGISIGFGILSKYLIALLLIAIFILLLKNRRYKQAIIFVMSFMPFLLFHIYANSQYCWTNFLFNFWYRHERSELNGEWPSIYVVTCLYVFTPWIVYKSYQNIKSNYKQRESLFLLMLIPLGLFGVISVFSLIGLHYLYGVIAFVAMSLLGIEYKSLLKILRYTSLFSLFHLILVFFLLTNPNKILSKFPGYDDYSYTINIKEISKQLNTNLPSDTVIAAKGFSPASLIGWELNRYIPTFGIGSFQGRNDDFFYDFSKDDGKNFRIFTRRIPTLIKYQPYFESIEVKKFIVDGQIYYYVDGVKFNYDLYRENVLKTILKNRYDILKYFPTCKCSFLEKYNFTE